VSPGPPRGMGALACPRCRASLSAGSLPDGLRCAACARAWPVVAGIADLSVGDDPFLTRAADHAAARALADVAAHRPFREVLASYYENNALVPPRQAAGIIRATLSAPERSGAFLLQATRLCGQPIERGDAVLDVGAGTGPLALRLAQEGASVWAVDIGTRWLALARARAAEAGLAFDCACASATALPFPDASFDVVLAESVLEWLPDQRGALREWHRVLRPGGRLLLATPNRWSPGPDPHLGLPLLSMAPGVVVRAASRVLGVLPPARELVGRGALRARLVEAGFADVRIEGPEIPVAVLARAPRLLRTAMAAYEGLRTHPLSAGLAAWMAPLHVAAARRPEFSAR